MEGARAGVCRCVDDSVNLDVAKIKKEFLFWKSGGVSYLEDCDSDTERIQAQLEIMSKPKITEDVGKIKKKGLVKKKEYVNVVIPKSGVYCCLCPRVDMTEGLLYTGCGRYAHSRCALGVPETYISSHLLDDDQRMVKFLLFCL